MADLLIGYIGSEGLELNILGRRTIFIDKPFVFQNIVFWTKFMKEQILL